MEYAKVLAGKKKAYAEYRKVWPEMQNYQIALKVAGACVGDENEQESIWKEEDQRQMQSHKR